MDPAVRLLPQVVLDTAYGPVVVKVMPVTVLAELLVMVMGTGVVVVPTDVVPKVVQFTTVRGPTGGVQEPVPL